jgi:hypothetical protein
MNGISFIVCHEIDVLDSNGLGIRRGREIVTFPIIRRDMKLMGNILAVE